MNIGIDISQMVYEGTGVARFTYGLVEAILENGSGHSWHFFFSSLRRRPSKNLMERIQKAGYSFHSFFFSPTMLSFLWNDLHLIDIRTLVGPLDWFISSDWAEPPGSLKKASVVHDLAFKRFPETVHPKVRSIQEKRLRWIEKETTVVFADSEATKQDLVTYYHMKPERIVPNHPGITLRTHEKTSEAVLYHRFQIAKPFILFVGKNEPRKNLDRLMRAFTNMNRDDIELVIVGPAGWGRLYSAPGVKVLGYVTDADLYGLYTSCLFFAYPSLWEGFGYPVVEAMFFGAPVLTSNSSSLVEITGEAAVHCDPLHIESIEQGMRLLIKDKKVRTILRKRGKERSTRFTWKRYYKTLIASFEQY